MPVVLLFLTIQLLRVTPIKKYNLLALPVLKAAVSFFYGKGRKDWSIKTSVSLRGYASKGRKAPELNSP